MIKGLTTDFQKTNFFLYYSEKGGLSYADFERLSSFLEFKTLPHSHQLLGAGEICKHSFFVESGLLQSYSLDDKGNEHIIQFAPENWLIADRSSQYFNEPSDYFIKAIEPSVVVLMHTDFLMEAGKLKTSFSCFLENSLQRNIHIQQKRIHSLLAMTAKERYVMFMDTYPNLLMRVPQWMIASYLGITPESLSRVRRELLVKR